MNEIVRELATVEKILDINPISGADMIEVASIRGWKVVVKKGQFKSGDLLVYCEIDSVMPERPEFEFLANKKYRIKTMKMKGQVSQGIAFPLSILPTDYKIELGADVTDILGIAKYEYPIPAELAGKVIGEFPSHSIKTDEERIQNLRDMWDAGFYHPYVWYETEKLDGTSATFSIFDNKFQISSRNLQLAETEDNSFWKVARRDGFEDLMRDLMACHNLNALTIQGELIGEGIQKNKYHLKGQQVRFFRSFLPEKYQYVKYDTFLDWMDSISLKTVPIINDNFKLPEKFDDLILHVEGRSQLYETAREGSVFVAKNAPIEQDHGRLSFKVISNKFIMKHNL